MKTKHTPLPWRLIKTDRGDMVISYSNGELRSHVATCHDLELCPEHGTVQANAEFILDAVNQFARLKAERDELVKLIKEFTDYYSGNRQAWLGNGHAYHWCDKARAVLERIGKGKL